jgi:PhnB protein
MNTRQQVAAMKRESRTVDRSHQVDQVESSGQRHLPLIDLLVDTRTELMELAVRNVKRRRGGQMVVRMMAWKDSPMPDQAPPGWATKILHAGLASGDGVLEGCDAMPGQYKKPESFCVMLRPKEASKADRMFKPLAEGGRVQIPIAETFWALRFAQVVDRFGVP